MRRRESGRPAPSRPSSFSLRAPVRARDALTALRQSLPSRVVDDQTVITLAQILQHAGAVDAMEFEINPEWQTSIT